MEHTTLFWGNKMEHIRNLSNLVGSEKECGRFFATI